jgi:hypothetical protein
MVAVADSALPARIRTFAITERAHAALELVFSNRIDLGINKCSGVCELLEKSGHHVAQEKNEQAVEDGLR